MRILIVNSIYPPSQIGGAEKSVALLAEALARRGDSITVVTLVEGDSYVRETRNGVGIYRVPIDNIFWPFHFGERPGNLSKFIWHSKDTWNSKAATRFAQIVDEVQPDVLHTNVLTGFSVSLWNVAQKRNIPVVHTLRDYSLACVRSSMYRNGATCQRRCADCVLLTEVRRIASARIQGVVSNSQFVIDAHKRNSFFKNVPSSVIFNIANIQPKQSDRQSSGEPRALVFGFIGRIEEEKIYPGALEGNGAFEKPRLGAQNRRSGDGSIHPVAQRTTWRF